MLQTSEPLRRYVLGDWGTSRLRLFLMDGAEIVDSREGPGIGAFAGRAPDSTDILADTLTGLIAPWTDAAQPMDVVLSGMIGSRNGLFDVPYARAPIDGAAWSRTAWSAKMSSLNITIAAGLRSGDQDGAPDVMRGEETQIFGAMQLDTALAAGSQLFVLPGTHSKWVNADNGKVTRFRTALTGEVFALLRDHSTLLKAGAGAISSDADTDAGFIAGIQRCARLDAGLLASLFEARTAQLLEQRSRAWASGFLSGLLIGYEVASLSASCSTIRSVRIIGDPNLTSLYQRVFTDRGVEVHLLDGAACAIAGLRYLRECTQENLQ